MFFVGMASMMKFAFLMGKAPADFTQMAAKLYPIVVKAPVVGLLGLTANQFIVILAVVEMFACLGFFFNHRIASVLVLVVMGGAEFIAVTQGGNPMMPMNPICGNKAVCMASHVFHLMLSAVALFVINAPKHLCAQVCSALGCSKGAEAPTPSRPRRAAAMKKKDQ